MYGFEQFTNIRPITDPMGTANPIYESLQNCIKQVKFLQTLRVVQVTLHLTESVEDLSNQGLLEATTNHQQIAENSRRDDGKPEHYVRQS